MQDVANCKCEKTLSNVNDLNDQTSIKNSQRTRYVQTINETKTIKQRTSLLSSKCQKVSNRVTFFYVAILVSVCRRYARSFSALQIGLLYYLCFFSIFAVSQYFLCATIQQ